MLKLTNTKKKQIKTTLMGQAKFTKFANTLLMGAQANQLLRGQPL